MADITMCTNTECKLKENCYRYTAKANQYRQSYFGDMTRINEDSECDYFWENKK